MLAETSDVPVGLPGGQNSKRSFGFEDGSPLKRTQNRERIDFRCPSSEIILIDTWGFRNCKHKQEQAIARLIDGGGQCCCRIPYRRGMSLLYQISALAFNSYDGLHSGPRGGGVTLVVSSLIALLKVRIPRTAVAKDGPCCQPANEKVKS